MDLTKELLIEIGALSEYTCVGSDHESGEYWQRDRRESLPLLGRIVFERPGTPRVSEPHGSPLAGAPVDDARFVRREARRLPDGDIMVIIDGKSWARYTRDERRIAEYRARKSIWGYRYERRLLDALCDLERLGRPPQHIYSWFGGTCGLDTIRLTGVQHSHSGGHAATAEEKLTRLREYLEPLCDTEWEGAEIARAALDFARDGSVVALVRESD